MASAQPSPGIPTGGPWRVDDRSDRVLASDRLSRFGAYLAARIEQAHRGEDIYDGPSWVAWCWWVATPLVMTPGYVTLGDTLDDTELWRDPDTGGLAATVRVRAPLAVRLPGWRSWERRPSGGIVEPNTTAPVALTTVTLKAQLEPPSGAWQSPAPAYTSRRALVDAAKQAVAEAIVALRSQFEAPVRQLATARPERAFAVPDVGGLA